MHGIGKTAVTAALSVCVFASVAQAAPRTFVSGKGADSGACSLAAPCRSFAYAATQTNDGGELVVLDTAGYGGLTITKSISIVNDGAGVASVQVPSGSAIIINAPTSAVIHLRGLTLEGANAAQHGIVFNTGGSLTVLNCLVRHFTGKGLYINPLNDMAFNVLDSKFLDNGNHGIHVIPVGQGSAHGIVDRVVSSGNQYGIVLDGGSPGFLPNTLTISNTILSLNQFGFFTSSGNSTSQTNALLKDVVVAQNQQTGVGAQQTGSGVAVLQLANTVVTANFTGVINQATIESFGNNQIHRNFVNLSGPALTSVAQQ